MKSKRELKRKGHFKFRSVDLKSGYAITFKQNKQGYWFVYVETMSANGCGSTVGKARKDIADLIPYMLEMYVENNMPIPKPEREPVSQ